MPLFGLSKSGVDKMEAKRDINGLIKVFKGRDAILTKLAVEALVKIGGEHTVDKLVVALGQYSEAIKCCDEALKINPNNKLALTIKERMMMEHPSIQSRYQHSTVWGMPVLDLRSGKEQAIAYRARSTLDSEDEEIAQKLAQLSKLSETQYSRDKAAYEETVAEFRSIGELLCANGGDERMKLIAYRVQALGGRLRNCEMYWDGICGWMH